MPVFSGVLSVCVHVLLACANGGGVLNESGMRENRRTCEFIAI